MVEAVENLTRVDGVVRACRPHPTLADRVIVTLAVDRASPVPGKADLMADAAGRDLDVTVRSALLGEDATGARLRCRVKRTPAGVMCEAHPDAADFTLTAA
jgi:hypothetical protein